MNEAEANIDSTLRKRFDLLNKSISIIKTTTKVEDNIMENIEKLRSQKLSNFDFDRKLYDLINEEQKGIKEKYNVAKVYPPLGFEIVKYVTYDNDIVETVNMSGQLYSIRDININKVTAIAETVRIYSDFNNVFSIPEKFDENSQASDIMICGFDNMKARQNFFNKWKQHVRNKPEGTENECLFIDGRLAAQEFQIFCIK